MGTGLQGPAGESGNSGDQSQSAWGHAQRLGLGPRFDPHFLRHAVGTGSLDAAAGRLIPVGGGGSGARAPAAEGSPFEMSVNPRAAAAFDALSDINTNADFTGGLTAIRDMGDAASFMNDQQAKGAVEGIKSLIGKSGAKIPTEDQLGAVRSYVNNGTEAVPVYDQKDLLNRYLGAHRMLLLERQGSIELDHDNWKIKSIGSSKLTPEQFVKEIRDRYGTAFADGVALADKRLSLGERPLGKNVPLDIQRGFLAHGHAQDELNDYSDSIGVHEGPGQLLALNRWGYYQDGSGLHGQPDVLIDPSIELRHILDGKATMFEELSPSMQKQLERYYLLGANKVEGTTPRGHILVQPKGTSERRR